MHLVMEHHFYYGFGIKNKFFITPVAGWQNAWASASFNRFVKDKNSATFKQNILLVFGCDFSLLKNSFIKSESENDKSVLGIKFLYLFPLSPQ